MLTANRITPLTDLVMKYKSSENRLIILDYNGILVPRELHPGLTVPSKEARDMVSELQNDERNTVILITDREIDYLEKYWFDTNVIIVAENGALFSQHGKTWQSVFDYDSSWLAAVAPAINALAFQYDGTFVERRSASIAWYYDSARKKIDYSELRQITADLRTLSRSNEFAVYHGDGFLELYTRGIDPGSFMARWISGRQYDFILSIAESRVDETMFGLFTDGAFLIRVSHGGFTHSNHVLDKQEEVLPLLSSLL